MPILASIVGWVLGLICVLGTAGSARAQQPVRPTAIVGVNLIRMDRERIEPEQTIVVAAGRIAAIGPTSTLRPPDGAEIVDGTGRYLLPGLVDSHVHITTDMPWAPARSDFGEGLLYPAHGVTTVVNLRGTPTQLAWKAAVERGDLLGPSIYTSGEFLNEPRVVTPEDVQREVSRQAREGYDVIKFHEVWTPAEGFLTRQGLSRESYVALFESAREAGLPVIGHVPVNLGLPGLLAASGGAVAHVGEFNRLHFLLGLRTLALTALASLVIFAVLASWGVAAFVRRLRRRPTRAAGFHTPALLRAQRLMAGVLVLVILVVVGGFVVGPGGLFYTSPAWRIATTIFAIALVVLGLHATAGLLRTMRAGVPGWTRAPMALAALSTLALVLLIAAMWVPFLWRSTENGIARLAIQLRDAGMAVQSTLVVYEAFDPKVAERVFDDPGFQFLTPELQRRWRGIAGQRRSQTVNRLIVPPRFAEFTRTIAGTLHRHGVLVLAGTDAMGAPMIVPGSSLVRELHLLHASGFTPYEAIRAATANPAVFLRKEKEFGTIDSGLRADFVLLDSNPLATLSAFERPVGVMVRGRWLPRQRVQELLSSLR